MGKYQFEIFKRYTLKGRRWYFRMRAPNGQIILSSEGYHNLDDCNGTVLKIKQKAFEAKTVFV